MSYLTPTVESTAKMLSATGTINIVFLINYPGAYHRSEINSDPCVSRQGRLYPLQWKAKPAAEDVKSPEVPSPGEETKQIVGLKTRCT